MLLKTLKTADEKYWLAFSRETVKETCTKECGEEMFEWCWGGGDQCDCISVYVKLCMTDVENTLIPVEEEDAD